MTTNFNRNDLIQEALTSNFTRNDLICEALSWCGTPYHHHQSVKGVGCDCVGLLLGVGKNIGFIDQSYVVSNYEPLARGSHLIREMNKWLKRTDDLTPANILVIRYGKLDTHAGILVNDDSVIHACAKANRVTISNIKRLTVSLAYEVGGIDD